MIVERSEGDYVGRECPPARSQGEPRSTERIMPHTGNSIRIGITGVPGVGKSTFIESFGQTVIGDGKKVAVLAVDPALQLQGFDSW